LSLGWGTSHKFSQQIVSASALILGGILTHYFTQRREERNEQQRALRENYKSILSRIDNLIRGSKADDAFSNIHLETWVVGSRDVIEGTKRLIAALRLSSRTDADIEMKSLQIRTELESLVAAMRRDVGLDRIDGITLENIYELKDATGITTPRSASATAV